MSHIFPHASVHGTVRTYIRTSHGINFFLILTVVLFLILVNGYCTVYANKKFCATGTLVPVRTCTGSMLVQYGTIQGYGTMRYRTSTGTSNRVLDCSSGSVDPDQFHMVPVP